MLQHNPHSHSIRCAGLQIVLDAYETRELSREEDALVPCVECDCKLMQTTKRKPAEPAE